MRGTSSQHVISAYFVSSLVLLCLSSCKNFQQESSYSSLTPAVIDRVGMCGGGLKESIGPTLRLQVARDIELSGALSVGVERSIRAAILTTVSSDDVAYVYGQYTACVVNRAENDQYIATLQVRRENLADQMRSHSLDDVFTSQLLALADQEIALYKAARFVDARNARKYLITRMMDAILSQPQNRWMVDYTLSEKSSNPKDIGKLASPERTPSAICRAIFSQDPYCGSAQFSKRADTVDLFRRAEDARCSFRVGPERAQCLAENEGKND